MLTGFEKIKVAVGYEIDGKIYNSYPGNLRKSKPLNIVYDELPGWTEDNYTDKKIMMNCLKIAKNI